MTPHHEVLDGADPGGPSRSTERARLRRIGSALSGMLVFGALTLVAANVVDSAQSRFAATTSNEGSLISTGAIDIVLADGSDGAGVDPRTRFDLLFDVELVGGQAVTRCIEVTYRGSVDDVLVGLYGEVTGGTGLDRHLLTAVDIGSGTDPDCADFVLGRPMFDGTFRALAAAHSSLATAIPVLDDPDDAESATVRIAVALGDDNAAQGLTTSFVFTMEART